jgi:hypothetical protein
MTTEAVAAKMSNPSFSTPKQFCEKNPWETIGGLRHKIFHSKNNGLDESGAIVRVGRKILINDPKYFSWIEGGQKGRVVQ